MKTATVVATVFALGFSLFAFTGSALAIPQELNKRCENGEVIVLDGAGEENAHEIDLSDRKNVQVCTVFFYGNGRVYRFTGDYESPQDGFYVKGLGMNKLLYKYQVKIWYEASRPDKVEVYYRYDLDGESLIGGPPVSPPPQNVFWKSLFLPVAVRKGN